MKKSVRILLATGAVLALATTALAETAQAPIHRISPEGVGEQIGMVIFTDTPQGLELNVEVLGLPAGPRGMHIHEVGDCGPGMTDGKAVAGLAAKGHFDPDKSSAHKGPHATGHKGDLPYLEVGADGKAKAKLLAPRLKVADIKNRALMIHAGGDNYADAPAPLGGGGARVACGVIK